MRRTSGSEYRETECATPWQAGISSPGDRACLKVFDARSGMARSLRAELADSAAYGTFERVALGYLAVSSALIVIFAANLAHPLRLLGVQSLVALLIVALCRAEANVWTTSSMPRSECFVDSRKRFRTLTQRF